ncbi:helix-turn-helix domain-containing protein [Aedoeadaptatus urinae]|uniref:helix-turn-helix domain-containing protein n=1 Tax=Aedoeadaptatus urinae TaxID=1871017 RepID=UPI00097DE5C8|nr:XRE family transcriptional regulator [Peptoniphilus urinae]
MSIGQKIRRLRQVQQLTQEELAQRSELTKGFISQVERDLTSPSVATFLDILEALGVSPNDFFKDGEEGQIVFSEEDAFSFEDEEGGYGVDYIVPNAQKNSMEPTLWRIAPMGSSKVLSPFEGEFFAYILSGRLDFCRGDDVYSVEAKDTIYATGDAPCFFRNLSRDEATVLWVSNPPNF